MRKRELIAAAAGAVSAIALAGGVAWAAIPSDGGVINGCYGKVGGVLRVIDTAKGQKCLPNAELALDWNQAGQPGAPGPSGQAGLQGPPGKDGLNGINGTSGADGINGTNGQDGESGQDGADGEDGAQGLRGPPGDPGQDGVSGYEIVPSSTFAWQPGFASFTTVSCPQGKKVIGGGVYPGGPDGVVIGSFPLNSGQWAAGIRNTSSETIQVQAWAICAIG